MSHNLNDIGGLFHWVTESTRGANYKGTTVEKRVQNLLDRQAPLEKERILYRVHLPNSKSIRPGKWFATSTDLSKVLRQHLAKNADCCLFKIHVQPGIRILEVDKILKTFGKETKYDESEVIIDKGGVFTHPSNVNGFKEIATTNKGVTTFETYYGLPKASKKQLTVEQVLNRINKNSYNFINEDTYKDDIKMFAQPERNGAEITNNVYKAVFNEIKKRKASNTSKGGRRKIHNKTRKRV